MAKLSVIIPVYNVEKYVQDCLESVERQTLDNIEVIVVDDGSTDNSGKIAKEICERNPNFRYIHKDNGGLMSAWVHGVKESTGDYIGFVDSDDKVRPEMFEVLLEIAKSNSADIVFCDYVDDSGKLYDTKALTPGLYEDEKLDRIRGHIFPVPGRFVISNARWNKLFKRNLIIDNLRYTECLSRTFEDRYIVPAAIMTAKRFVYVNEPLYIYTNTRANSNSKQYKPDLLEQIKRFYNIQGQMLEDKGLKEKYCADWEAVFIDRKSVV